MAVEAVEGGIESHRLAAGTHADRLAEPGARDVWSLFRPKSPAVPTNTCKPDALTVWELVNVGFSIKQRDAGGFNKPAKGDPARTAPIVIAKDRDHRSIEIGEHLVRKLALRQTTAFRDVPGDDDQIDVGIHFPHRARELLRNLIVQVEIANRRNPDRSVLPFFIRHPGMWFILGHDHLCTRRPASLDRKASCFNDGSNLSARR